MRTYRVVAVLLLMMLGAAPLLPAPGTWALAGAPDAAPTETGSFSAAHAAYLLDAAPHVAGIPTTSAQARQSVARWTVMVYMAADNDLERFALSDLNEMEIVGSTTEVNIVAQVDRAQGYDTSDGDWTETRRYFITRDRRLSRLGSEPVDGFARETNTGDPATLSDFAIWAMTTYPAEHYGLIIWDHGGSWLGVATDDSAGQDDLILPELDEALSTITAATGRDRLDFVGFDACLMGAFEVYQAVAPYALFGIGSADLIPGNGWDYTGAFNALAADPSMTGDLVGRAIVDAFMTFYTTVVTNYPIFNLAVVDLSQAGDVTDALEALNQVVNESPDSAAEAIVAARNATPEYGAFDDPQYADVWAAADLIQFLLHLRETAGIESLSSAAARAADAARSLLIYYRSSTGEGPRAGARAVIDAPANAGISIYFPQDAKAFLQTPNARRYTQETPLGVAQWSALLTTLFNIALQTLDAANLTGNITGITGSGSQAEIELDSSLSALSRAALVITLDLGGGQSIVIDYAPNPNAATTWNGLVPYLTNGKTEIPVLVLRHKTNAGMGIVNGRFLLPDGSTLRAQLIFDLATNEMISAWGFRPSSHSLMPFELVTEVGDLFQPSWITLGVGNRLFSIPAAAQLTVEPTPFRLVWRRAPVGAYRVILLLNDAAGNAGRSGLIIALTGEDEEDLGLIVLDPENPDMDGDGLLNEEDNCPAVPNLDQADTDEDGFGDACDIFDDRDLDGDGVPRGSDNCVGLFNPDQADSDGDGTGDACDIFGDSDGDGIPDSLDNCPDVPNPFQLDDDHDGIGNECDPVFDPDDDFWDNFWDQGGGDDVVDSDGDGIEDSLDNCPFNWNPDQADSDGNGLGDACDVGPDEPESDFDGDGIPDSLDNCPFDWNPDQADSDGDGQGDACPYDLDDLDLDDDGVLDFDDNCLTVYNPDQADSDGDGIGDACAPAPPSLPDMDGDGIPDDQDNCPSIANPDQADNDIDGIGDLCDSDADGDGWSDSEDNCPQVANPGQEDRDEDFIGDACDDDLDGDEWPNSIDNCPTEWNSDQADSNQNGIGDACEDTDGDGWPDSYDNCPLDWNPDQADSDFDGQGDACDPMADLGVEVLVSNPTPADGETVTFTLNITNHGPGAASNITYYADWGATTCWPPYTTGPAWSNTLASLNVGQTFSTVIASFTAGQSGHCSASANASISSSTPPDYNSGNDFGSASFVFYPPDADGDGVPDWADNCPTVGNPDQMDSDGNGQGDACDPLADVSVAVAVSNPVPADGEVVTFTITFTNFGPYPVSAVDYARGIGFVSCTGVPGSGTTAPTPLGSLAVGQTVTQTISYTAGTTCSANVSATVLNAVPRDYNTGNDSASNAFAYYPPDSDGDGVHDLMDNCPGIGNPDQTDTDGNGQGDACDPVTDIAASILVSNPAPANGEIVSFTLNITNLGPSAATAINYGVGYAYVTCSPPVGGGPTFAGTVPSLNVGETYSAAIASFEAGVYCSGSADVNVSGSTPRDWNSSNNSASGSFTYTP